MHSKKKTLYGAIAAGTLLLGAVLTDGALAATATDLKCKGCVGSKDIAKKAVTSKHLKPKSVKPSHLHGSAKPAGLDHTSGDQSFPLSSSQQTVRLVTVNAPAAGRVMVIASWTISDTTGGASVCSISEDSNLDTTHGVYTYVSVDVPYAPGGAVRSFDVGAGENTFNLVCLGTASAENLFDSSMTGVYVPGAY